MINTQEYRRVRLSKAKNYLKLLLFKGMASALEKRLPCWLRQSVTTNDGKGERQPVHPVVAPHIRVWPQPTAQPLLRHHSLVSRTTQPTQKAREELSAWLSATVWCDWLLSNTDTRTLKSFIKPNKTLENSVQGILLD